MHWLDTSTLLILAGAAVVGLVFGFFKPLFRLGTVFLALFTAASLAPMITGASVVPGPRLIGLIFVVSLALYAGILIAIRRNLWKAAPDLASGLAKLRWIDRLMGATVAVVLSAAGIGLALVVIQRAGSPDLESRFRGSRTYAETKSRIEPKLQTMSEGQKAQLKEGIEWLKKNGETPAKTPATTLSPNTPAPGK